MTDDDRTVYFPTPGTAIPGDFLDVLESAITPNTQRQLAGQVANQIAGAHVFEDYRSRRAANTIRRQDNDLSLFADFLRSTGLTVGDFSHDPQAWAGITWGLVEGFRRWLLVKGYAVGSVNVRLSTLRMYAAMAAMAGALDRSDLVLIKEIHGYKQSEAKHVDELRNTTRKSNKKAEPVSMTPTQAARLKAQPDTPQGRRDRLLFCLLLDHGLRCGEVAELTVADFDLAVGELRFYRPKVDKVQTHRLTDDTLLAARAYLANDAPPAGGVWRGSRKGGQLNSQAMSVRAITARVNYLARKLTGLRGLSAHDLRHYWATQAARSGTALDRLQDAGGWSSVAMPARYIETAKIANQGVKLE